MDENQANQVSNGSGDNRSPNSYKGLIIAAIIVIIAIAFFAISNKDIDDDKAKNNNQSQDSQQTIDPEDNDAMKARENSADGDSMTTTKTFQLTGKNFSFEPNAFSVKKGDIVKVIFNNEQGFHDFVIDEFKAATAQIQEGSTTEVTFVADQAGSFEFYCSIGNHRAQGMVGTLTVEE